MNVQNKMHYFNDMSILILQEIYNCK